MEAMHFDPQLIQQFQSEHALPNIYLNSFGFPLDYQPELLKKVKEIETQYDCVVYAITESILEDMVLWSLLCVPEDAESVTDVVSQVSSSDPNQFYAFAYVLNDTVDYFSEFGDVVVEACNGNIRRLG
jgi:hypothetical protein